MRVRIRGFAAEEGILGVFGVWVVHMDKSNV